MRLGSGRQAENRKVIVGVKGGGGGGGEMGGQVFVVPMDDLPLE